MLPRRGSGLLTLASLSDLRETGSTLDNQQGSSQSSFYMRGFRDTTDFPYLNFTDCHAAESGQVATSRRALPSIAAELTADPHSLQVSSLAVHGVQTQTFTESSWPEHIFLGASKRRQSAAAAARSC